MDRVPQVGDILVNNWGAYAHRTHIFAHIVKITKTGRIRINILSKQIVQQDGDNTIVAPGGNETGETKLLKADRCYGRGTLAEYWPFYDPTKVYTDHFDRGA